MIQTLTPAAPPRKEAPPLDFDERLKLAVLAVDARIDSTPPELLDLADVIRLPAEAPALVPQLSPIADCLHRARTILQERGWCTGALRGEQGAVCVAGAIRAAATSRGQADDACALLLDAIQREFTTETVPSWNDAQTGPAAPMRLLGQAADLAASRGI